MRNASRTVWRLAEKRAINSVSVGSNFPTGVLPSRISFCSSAAISR
jgi:hypothetical protein